MIAENRLHEVVPLRLQQPRLLFVEGFQARLGLLEDVLGRPLLFDLFSLLDERTLPKSHCEKCKLISTRTL